MGLFDEIKTGKKRIQIKCATLPYQQVYKIGDKIETWTGEDGMYYGIDLDDKNQLQKYVVVVFNGAIAAVFDSPVACHNYDGDKVLINEFLTE